MTQATSRGMFSGCGVGTHVVDLGARVDHPGVDEHEPVRMVDRPDEHGHLLAFDEELRREMGANHVPNLPPVGVPLYRSSIPERSPICSASPTMMPSGPRM